jgi:ATP-dependent DNA helicase RecG
VRAATQTHAELRDGLFRDFRVGLLHGRQDEATKSAVMDSFRKRELDLLVCTSVIEVGVDVPNATLLVIEHAERFGLSQLHQLRGRVSRGSVAGECFLFAEPPSDEGRRRLRAFLRTTDGFALAEEDMKLRGTGEFFGARQHGLGELRLGNLIADADLLRQARKDAFALVAEDAGLRRPEHALLRAAVLERYGKTLDLAEIG